MSMELLMKHINSGRKSNYFFHPSSNGMAAAATTVIFFVIFLGFPASFADSSDTAELIHPRVFVGRSLLQTTTDCPIDVQNWNYTIITSKCKGPSYPPETCCDALKDLACPYSRDLNDLTNNCADTMFSYINLYGNYPPGLFANTCRDTQRGLECTDAQSSGSPHASSTSITAVPAPTIALFFLLPFLYCIFL